MALGVGYDSSSGRFRALIQGYKFWASGRVQSVAINMQNPCICFVRAKVFPSMKDEVYVVDLLINHQTAKVERAQIQVYCWVCCSTIKLLLYCVIIMFLTSCSLSASCVHVSAVLHYLVGLKGHHFMTPSQQETSDSENEDDQQPLPVTSFQCQWKQPRKRKESNLRISEVALKKHQFGPQKRKRDTIEEFDPRPIHLHDTAPTNLLTFLSSVRDLEPKLGVSVLMDETLTSQYRVPEEDIPQQVEVLIKTLTLSEDERRSVESNTREQSQCREWHTSRKHRLTASNFGKVLTNSKPEGLVKQILYPQDISHIPAIVWGREKEAAAVSTYTEYHRKNGNGGVIVSKIGFLVSETHPFLGALPDRCVYDPTSPNDPYGFLEIKCPYKHRGQPSIGMFGQGLLWLF